MAANFAQAADRHFKDANLLYKNSSWANADQLYGFSSECVLKAIMEKCGMGMNNGAPSNRSHRVHVNILWNVYRSFTSGLISTKYMYIMGSTNPYSNWDASQRYEETSTIGKSITEAHKCAAEKVMAMKKMAILDGIL